MATLDKDLQSNVRHWELIGSPAEKIGNDQRAHRAAKVLSGVSNADTRMGTADPIKAGIPSSPWKRSELPFALALLQREYPSPWS